MDERLYVGIRAGRVRVNNRSPERLRFWKNVDKDGPPCPGLGQCWVWTGTHFRRNGVRSYGRLTFGGGPERAHRASWILHNGPIPDKMLVLHRCDNPPCVNPAHLFLGTDGDNTRDRCLKGRGGRSGKMLHPDVVTAILAAFRPGPGRGRYGGNSAEVAEEFGVTAAVVQGIVFGRTYKHVPRAVHIYNTRNKVEAGVSTVQAAGT